MLVIVLFPLNGKVASKHTHIAIPFEHMDSAPLTYMACTGGSSLFSSACLILHNTKQLCAHIYLDNQFYLYKNKQEIRKYIVREYMIPIFDV